MVIHPILYIADMPKSGTSVDIWGLNWILAAIEVFTADIVRRAKDVENLIAALPTKDDSGERVYRESSRR